MESYRPSDLPKPKMEDSHNFSTKIRESSISKPNLEDLVAKTTAFKISGLASGYILSSNGNNVYLKANVSLTEVLPFSNEKIHGVKYKTELNMENIHKKSPEKISPENLLMHTVVNGKVKFKSVEGNSKEAKEYLSKGNKFSVIDGDTIKAPKGSPLLGQKTAKYNGKVFNTEEQSDDLASAVQEQAEDYILQQSIIEAKPEKKDFPSYTRERSSALPVYVAVKVVTPHETTHFVTDLSGLIATLMKDTHSKNWIEEEHNKEYADNKEVKMKNVLVKCIMYFEHEFRENQASKVDGSIQEQNFKWGSKNVVKFSTNESAA